MDRIGLLELLNDANAITVIEWADRLPPGLLRGLKNDIRVHIAHSAEPASRTITFPG